LLPDIIISDIMMEGLNGIDLCKAVKDNQALSHIPVILLTGTSSEELKLTGVKGGADDYIMKPFDKELLLARVGNLLKSKNSLQRYFYNEITLSNQDAKISDEYRLLLEKCIELVEEHLDDEQFNSKKMAQQMGMSYSSLTKKVKTISGQSLNSFIRFVRLRKAARLFIDSAHNVNEVASLVGIFDARYFREQFSRQFGMNPSDFIKKYRKPFANKFTINKNYLKGK
ncbi:MAG TPA: DNA-binding response regulator, partial [Niabella sp.]|nr:DNA-binding response regulator [Niabella sp.]